MGEELSQSEKQANGGKTQVAALVSQFARDSLMFWIIKLQPLCICHNL